MLRQFVPLAHLLGDAIQEIIDRHGGETDVLARVHLEILAHFSLHVELYIDVDRFFLKEFCRYAKDDGSTAVEILVFAAGAVIRAMIAPIRRQRCPLLVQHAKHNDRLLQDDFVELGSPRDKQLFIALINATIIH